ncbi:ABC transporter ATP-binding protein [Piscinibacter terrae]|uniref:ABC transporter ATP-binding protein n=1 Tax=Piscinibacter terrae TaxID=2496871 RepID=A0A3N7J641_9BURK|nr:ABC transporter ATP-binding protein [Albitalea terrae]RQP26282.1 ABC transporter ATP-binding protein [Albitalea terrae]
MASISLSGVTKRFGPVTAVDDLQLDVQDGEFFVLLGPSGAGKTTTLRLVAGIERPDEGRVLMNGEDITDMPPAQRDCAFVFQQYSLYPHLTVFDNIAFPLRSPMRRTPPAEIKQRVERVAQTLHIENKLHRKATALSGGEMQRVAIGRALVREPRVFLMDEPLSSLDAQLREELRVELKRLQRQSGATVLYVTHDQVEATTLADRIAILEHGRIQQVGTPLQVYEDPQSLHVAQRLGAPAINVLPAEWFEGSGPPRATHVAIRPEDVAVGAGNGPSHFDVIECSLVKHLVVAERSGVEVRAHTRMDQALHPGAPVRLSFPPDRCLFFDASGQRLPV